MATDLIAVTGATGALGRLVLAELLERVPPSRVVAVVRDPGRVDGVEARHGDYDEPESLRRAFEGVDRLLLISSPELDPARRVAQHRNAIEAASGVGLLAYTSFLGADEPGPGVTEAHHATETAISESGLPYTMLRNPFYTEAFVHPGLPALPELTSGTGGRGLNTATRADLAAAAAAVLTTGGHERRAYDLTGPLWTYPELAGLLGMAYREEPPPGPMAYLHGLAKAGRLERQTGDLESLLGRAPAGIAEVLRDARR
ncbi:NAD(P)H-binding protein [Dactylosporangium sp. NPDC000244]|uniref:NAD(P)H-binding protein n=1 Tax=Dactylosporangium sp. NPDC000244 TaxID=3154365 RepID=UPI003319E840